MLSHLVDIQQKTEEVQISPTYNTNKFSSEKRNKERGEKQRKQTNTERKKAETIKKKHCIRPRMSWLLMTPRQSLLNEYTTYTRCDTFDQRHDMIIAAIITHRLYLVGTINSVKKTT